MPTEREREYYSMGYSDGRASTIKYPEELRIEVMKDQAKRKKRKLSAWNKFVICSGQFKKTPFQVC